MVEIMYFSDSYHDESYTVKSVEFFLHNRLKKNSANEYEPIPENEKDHEQIRIFNSRNGQPDEAKHKEIYAKLKAIHDNSENDSIMSSKIIESPKGSVGLGVNLQEYIKDAPVSFTIADGKIVFSSTDITPEQAKLLHDFFHRRGISGFSFPDSFNEALKKNLEEGKKLSWQERDNDFRSKFKGMDKNFEYVYNPDDEKEKYDYTKDPDFSNHDLDGLDNDTSNKPTSSRNTNSNNNSSNSNDDEPAEKEEPKKASTPDLENPYDEMKKFMTKVGKTRGFSYSTNLRGNEFFIYKGNMYDKKNKKQEPFMTISYKYKKNKKGGGKHFQMGYSVKNGDKIDLDYAKGMVDVFMSQGCTHIEFPNNVSDSDAAVWRQACAEKGIVPMNVTMNEHHTATMVEQASKRLPDGKFQKYKYALALQLEENAAKGGADPKKHRTAHYVRVLKAAERLNNFKDIYQDPATPLHKEHKVSTIIGDIDKENRTNKPERSIASATAAAELMMMMANNDTINILQQQSHEKLEEYPASIRNDESNINLEKFFKKHEGKFAGDLQTAEVQELYVLLKNRNLKTTTQDIEDELKVPDANRYEVLKSMTQSALADVQSAIRECKSYGFDMARPEVRQGKVRNPNQQQGGGRRGGGR